MLGRTAVRPYETNESISSSRRGVNSRSLFNRGSGVGARYHSYESPLPNVGEGGRRTRGDRGEGVILRILQFGEISDRSKHLNQKQH